MNLTLFSDYSLRVLMFAALRPGVSFSVDDVAEAYRLSRHHIAKVVNFLSQGGYLSAKRGRGGGIRLGREAGSIRIGALLRETETGPGLLECFDPQTNTCPLIKACRLKGVLAEAVTAFFAVLDGYTLADLVRRPQPLRDVLALSA
jgi:Rrf2 family transcriptional regulator, nitric oxide-sensitive transcriptional repressor